MHSHTNNKDNQDSAYHQRSLFGRRQGRALKGERKRAYEDVLPTISISEEQLKPDTDPAKLFEQSYTQYYLEIGFGHGERLAQDAQENPNTGFIGAEPFVNGIADFANTVQHQNQDNIRVLEDDGILIAKNLKAQSLNKILILNPDPWHKTRHHKRRIINKKNLDIFANILKPNGALVLTTDVENLAEWMCLHTNNHPAFDWQANNKNDWDKPPPNWIPTHYEQKGAKGAKKMAYLIFKRNTCMI